MNYSSLPPSSIQLQSISIFIHQTMGQKRQFFVKEVKIMCFFVIFGHYSRLLILILVKISKIETIMILLTSENLFPTSLYEEVYLNIKSKILTLLLC